MGTLIAVEGVDGAGKFTLSSRLVRAWERAGIDAVRVGFPRYGESIHADLAAEALAGEHGDLADGVNAMAVLFALDRAGAAEKIAELLSANDIVLLDRYVASNAAYNAARMHQGVDGEMVAWVRELELGRLGLPAPDLQMYLDVPIALANERARSREVEDSTRERDAYERDGDLQVRTGELYSQLAAAEWISPWWVIGPDTDPSDLARKLADFG